jgi:hypothetical protein
LIRHSKEAIVPVAAGASIREETRKLREKLPDVTGTLVATIDGLLIAHDTEGLEPETLAAMSAAQLGLGRQFAATSAHGEFLESVTRSSDGCLAVFAAGTSALLTVLASTDLNVGRLYHEARPVAARLGALLAEVGDAPTANHKDPAMAQRVRTKGR